MAGNLKNWAGNLEYSTANVHYPETIDQMQDLVRRLPKCRVVGTRHSFNTIADSTDNLISLERFTPVINIDRERKTVSISGNINYGALADVLHREGFALHNLASLPHISVAGAISTATHGSGVRNPNLATAISALDIVNGHGDLVRVSREHDGDRFDGAVVALGGLGVIVGLTLDLLPTFEISQTVYENLPIAQMEAHFDEIMASAYSVSLFTTWQTDRIDQVWLKSRSDDPNFAAPRAELFGAVRATRPMHPIPGIAADKCTTQLGIPGPWHERLPHFRYDATPSAGDELQSEYFVRHDQAIAALRAVRALHDVIAPHLLISEIRTIAADNLWLSPCYQQESVGFHFTWQQDWASVREVLPKIEEALVPFEARPHWGKMFTMPSARIQSLYKKLPESKELLHEFDPDSKFRNAFLDSTLF